MDRYQILCSEEQTKKALELRAPIDILDCDVWIDDRMNIGTSGFPCHTPILKDYLYDDDYNRREELVLIENHDEYGDMVVFKPTAEQMIGWLEAECGVIDFNAVRNIDFAKDYGFDFIDTYCYSVFFEDKHKCTGSEFSTKKEATLAAIDAALEYLKAKEEKKCEQKN